MCRRGIGVVGLVLVVMIVGPRIGQSNASSFAGKPHVLPERPDLHFLQSKELDLEVGINELRVVEFLYRTLELATLRAGTPVEFEISNLETHYPSEFSQLRWFDVVSHSPVRLRIERTEIVLPEERTVAYEAEWSDLGTMALDPQLLKASVESALAAATLENQKLASAVALTTFRVRATHAENDITYNAALLWLTGRDSTQVDFTVHDNVTDRVGEAVIERIRFVNRRAVLESFSGMPLESADQNAFLYESSTYCPTRNWNHQFVVDAGYDTVEHTSGYHRNRKTFKYNCSCDNTCRSTCMPELPFDPGQCYDWGNIEGLKTHRAYTSQKLQPGSVPDASMIGADCGAGYACYIESCPHGICSGIQIGAQAQPLGVGVQITFTASSQPLWDAQVNFPFRCAGCSWDAYGGDPNPHPEHDHAGEGGGGGGWSHCYFFCFGTYQCGGQFCETCNLVC